MRVDNCAEARRVAPCRDDPFGPRDARGLHGREAHGPGRSENEHPVARTGRGPPDDREPAGEAGRPAGARDLVGDAFRKH